MIIPYIDYSHTYETGTQINGQVFISLKDATTGNPINGDNIIIYYSQLIGGVQTDSQATIPGQGLAIYSGLLQDTSTHFYTSFWITGQSAIPNPAPPVNQCDLAIQSIIVLQNESFIGQLDGSIKVNATSSYLPIQYSLDNITFQDSNVFSGLAGGNYTVYAKDANTIGCLVQSTVTVPTNSNLLISDPSVALAGSNVSRWNAAFNPVVFTYQRRDFDVTSVILSTFNSKASINVNCDTSSIQEDDYIYLNAAPYIGVYQVLSVASPSQLNLNTAYLGNGTGFVNIDRIKPYYKIYTKLTYNDPITGQPVTLISKNSADNTGLVRADFQNFLQSLLQAIDQSQYNLVNYRDANLSASYQISYAEHWEDGSINSDGTTGFTSNWIEVDKTYYVVYAAKQLQDQYGGNLAAFVPFKTKSAKWITDFKEPVYSLTYPFDMSFIYSEDLAGLQLYYKISLLDINRQEIGGTGLISSFLLNEDGSFLLNEDSSRFIIAQQQYYNVPIVEHVGLNRLLIDEALDDNVYYIKIAIFYDMVVDDETITTQVMQDQVIRVDKNCDYNSVYLRWIGLNGSWNYYRFIYNQQVNLDVQNAVLVTKYVQDWTNADTIEDIISKSASEKITISAEAISVDEIMGLQSIKFSPKVQVCTNQSPAKWQTIIINTATFVEYETNTGEYPFSITFNKPSINIQTQ